MPTRAGRQIGSLLLQETMEMKTNGNGNLVRGESMEMRRKGKGSVEEGFYRAATDYLPPPPTLCFSSLGDNAMEWGWLRPKETSVLANAEYLLEIFHMCVFSLEGCLLLPSRAASKMRREGKRKTRERQLTN